MIDIFTDIENICHIADSQRSDIKQSLDKINQTHS